MDNLELAKVANQVRIDALSSIYSAKSGHPGGCLSAADAIAYLYYEEMNVDPADPDNEDRDRFVLSKGHVAPALYSVLARKGYFSVDELKKLRQPDSFLQGHPDMKSTPGVDMSSGSLGQGISAAVGMALAAKINSKKYRVYTMIGDGEAEEGQVWEACMFAGNRQLDNLVVIVDYNNLQIDGTLDEVCTPLPFAEKFESFKFHSIEIDGHNFDEMRSAFSEARNTTGMPTAIIMKTVKGKGVSYMENNVSWHGMAPGEELYIQAMDELKKAGEELCQK